MIVSYLTYGPSSESVKGLVLLIKILQITNKSGGTTGQSSKRPAKFHLIIISTRATLEGVMVYKAVWHLLHCVLRFAVITLHFTKLYLELFNLQDTFILRKTCLVFLASF